MLVLAHTGHWIGQVLYIVPLLVFVVILVRVKLQERREGRTDAPADAGGALEP
jgi:hypothetical protein